MENSLFRFATEKDVSIILDFIKELATYEELSQGAAAMDQWTVYRIAGDRLKEFAKE